MFFLLLILNDIIFNCKGDPPARDEAPDDIPLPLERWKIGSVWGWHASALLPDGDNFETLQYWRKRFRQSRAELISGTVNIASGTYRDHNMPMPARAVREDDGLGAG